MSFFKIIRPFNCFFVVLTVIFGAYYRSSDFFYNPVFFAVLSAFLIAAGGYVINDFFDYKIDLINKPKRILPSGQMKPKTALIFAIFLLIAGIFSSFFTTNYFCILIAIVNSLLLFCYAKIFKRKFLVGNLLVSWAAASTFLFGGISNNNLLNSLVITIFAFLYTFTRELIKDAEDIEGDTRLGATTLAVKFGIKKTVLVSLFPIFLVISFILLLFLKQELSLQTFILLNLIGSLPLIFFIIFLWNNGTQKNLSRISTWMKIDMLVLLFIFGLGNNYENL